VRETFFRVRCGGQCYSHGLNARGIAPLSLGKYVGSLLVLLTMTACSDGLIVSDAYIRGLPPGQTVTAAFMTLTNGLNQDCRLVGAISPVASSAEIHAHTHQNGTMSMRPVDEVILPKGRSVSFEPGGYHLMLFGLQKSLLDGEGYRVTLLFKGCPKVTVTMPVHSVLREKEG
jgi:copper(I)-binding protein